MHGRIVEPSKEVDEIARLVIGAAIEVHRVLGAGFLESVYESALAQELQRRAVRFETQYVMPVLYKGKDVGLHRVDLLAEGQLIVELKAVEQILPIHRAQVISYLKALNKQLALLINFNVQVLRDGGIKRIVYSH